MKLIKLNLYIVCAFLFWITSNECLSPYTLQPLGHVYVRKVSLDTISIYFWRPKYSVDSYIYNLTAIQTDLSNFIIPHTKTKTIKSIPPYDHRFDKINTKYSIHVIPLINNQKRFDLASDKAHIDIGVCLSWNHIEYDNQNPCKSAFCYNFPKAICDAYRVRKGCEPTYKLNGRPINCQNYKLLPKRVKLLRDIKLNTVDIQAGRYNRVNKYYITTRNCQTNEVTNAQGTKATFNVSNDQIVFMTITPVTKNNYTLNVARVNVSYVRLSKNTTKNWICRPGVYVNEIVTDYLCSICRNNGTGTEFKCYNCMILNTLSHESNIHPYLYETLY